jgi:hypothetical protein
MKPITSPIYVYIPNIAPHPRGSQSVAFQMKQETQIGLVEILELVGHGPSDVRSVMPLYQEKSDVQTMLVARKIAHDLTANLKKSYFFG